MEVKVKTPDVPNARLWFAVEKDSSDKTLLRCVHIECERWNDARDIARRYLGTDVVVSSSDAGEAPFPRIQLRWVGSAAGANTLRKQARFVVTKKAKGAWKEMRDF